MFVRRNASSLGKVFALSVGLAIIVGLVILVRVFTSLGWIQVALLVALAVLINGVLIARNGQWEDE